MAFPRPQHLSLSDIDEALHGVESSGRLIVTRVRPHNRGEIRRAVEMSALDLRELIRASIEDGHLPGGDLEVELPGISKRLVGHHDGVFWFEAPQEPEV